MGPQISSMIQAMVAFQTDQADGTPKEEKYETGGTHAWSVLLKEFEPKLQYMRR